MTGDLTTNAVDFVEPGHDQQLTERRSPLAQAAHTVARKPLAIISVIWLTAVVIGSLFADQLSRYSPYKQNIVAALQGPSRTYLLGTDDVGRDVMSRLLHGGGTLMLTSAESVVVAVLIGVPLGLLAGYASGYLDETASFAMNVLLAVPGFVILIAVLVVTENNLWIVMAVLGILFSANFFRLARATTQASRSLPYVDTARVAGLARPRILVRHILPNVSGPLIVQAFLTFGVALIIASSLAFLGLGTSPEEPNWGQMVFVAQQNLNIDPWLMVPVGLVLILTIMSANLIGSAIRDALPQAQRQRLLVDVHTAHRHPQREEPAIAPTTSAVLEVRDLSIAFDVDGQSQTVVDRVSFSVERGRTIGLVGESGCGKTMTALSLVGLIPPPGGISRGSIFLDGVDVAGIPEQQRAELRGARIALVSQEPMVALDPCYTIGSLLREPLRRHRKLTRRQADAEALSLLRTVGIARPEAVASSYPHQISGGMAQRVCIALALTGEPDLLVADEPTTALDVTIQAEILDLLRGLQERLGMTIVIVTHDLGVVADICTDVVVMYAGEVIESGPSTKVLENPSHPYTRALLGAYPDLARPGRDLPTVDGTVPLPADWPSWCRFFDRCPFAVARCQSGPVELEQHQPDHRVRCVRANELHEMRGLAP